MKDVGLSQNNARHRLRFRQLKTCGKDFCKKKAIASRTILKTKTPGPKKKTRDDAIQECKLYLSDFLRTVHPDLVDGISSRGPDMAAYRKMMGIRC
jgi:hypothetical protein